MSAQPERPARMKVRPRPAADENLDPVDYRSEARATPPPTPAQGPVRKEATVQLATRISLEIDAILTNAAATTGKSKRALVEEAIKNTWGTQ